MNFPIIALIQALFHNAAHRREFPVLLIASLMLVFNNPLAAQESSASSTIEGRVLNPLTGDYLNNAVVTLEGTNREVMTDSSGAYRLSQVVPGTVTLRVFYTGLDTQRVDLDVPAGTTVTQNIEMTSRSRYGAGDDVVSLDKFVVETTREMDAADIATNEQRFAPSLKNVVAADAFGDVGEGNVGEFVKYLPGVSINYGAGDAATMVLRGLPPSFTPVTIDGVSMASAASSGTSRQFEFEQVSINNAARVEITKSQIPSLPANSIGGSLNLISKRAFDRTRPLFSYRTFLTFTDEDRSLDKTPGPGTKETRKARPGLDFSYIAPVSADFGYTVTGMYSDQYGRERFSAPTWEYLPNNGGSESNPFLRGYQLRDDPRETKRQSIGLGADWRPFKALTLTFNYRFNDYDLQTNVNRLTFNTGTKPTSFDESNTQGRTNAGSVTQSPLWTNKVGNTNFLALKGNYRAGDWKADFSLGYSKSKVNYTDLESGFFRTGSIRINTPTVGYSGISSIRPGEITVTKGAALTDWRNIDNYTVLSGESLPIQSRDEIASGELNLRREFSAGSFPFAVQVGGHYRRQVRDRAQQRFIYNYLEPVPSSRIWKRGVQDDMRCGQMAVRAGGV